MKNARKMVILAILVSQALILSIIESWIPIPIPIPVPGIKLGLANIVTLLVIVFFGYKETLVVVLVRCLLSSLFTGGITVFMFSISGGILSASIMSLLYKKLSKTLSLIGISIAGGVMHNIGQIIMALLVLKESAVLGYLPFLIIIGVLTGLLIGIIGKLLIQHLKTLNIN